MDLDLIERAMDMLPNGKGKEQQLRLLGGEPTLHPELPAIIDRAIERGLDVMIFSNGMMPDRAVEAIEKYPDKRISILCNISPQADDRPHLVERRETVLKRLGSRMVPGVTISSVQEDIDIGMYIEKIERYGMRRKIRVGIAQPIVGKDNEHVSPADYAAVGALVSRMARVCIEKDILLGFDCGMTPCMFTGDEWETVMTCTDGFKNICHPIIDVGPDGYIWHCFPLSEVLNERLENFSDRNAIVAHYEKKVAAFRQFGCKPECVQCDFKRRDQCNGGCLAHAMSASNFFSD